MSAVLFSCQNTESLFSQCWDDFALYQNTPLKDGVLAENKLCPIVIVPIYL